jgi:hypothetical protein
VSRGFIASCFLSCLLCDLFSDARIEHSLAPLFFCVFLAI